MTPEQRRQMIVAAALPLVAERGAAVTTAQVARAAAIGEGTIFRVFKDKDELIDACVAEVLSPDHTVREIGSVSLDQPLADRLAEAADALAADFGRITAMMAALHASGRARRPGPDRPPQADRDESMAAVRDAMAELFEPERATLRLPAEQLAAMFLGLLFTRSRIHTGLDTAELVDTFLNGAIKEEQA
ncbi:helix-turn-helix domain-containing protein [Saccharopolyspora taberi]